MRRLARFWYWSVPPERLAVTRILVGAFALVYLIIRAPSLLSVIDFLPAQFVPVGLATWLPAPLPPPLVIASVTLALVTAPLFMLGAAFAYSAPVFALALLWVTTYRSSWGMIFHTENLLTLHVLLLAMSPAADVWSFDARRAQQRAVAPPSEPDARYGWALCAMSLVTVIAYALAGVAKLKLSGGAWLTGELLRAQIAYDNLRKIELGTQVSPLGPWLVRHHGVFRALALLTMLVELGAPLALVRGRVTAAWAVLAWGFHLSVLLMMSIAFPYQLCGVAYVSLFPVERAWAWLKLRFLSRSRP
jgi:hypothetical protein